MAAVLTGRRFGFQAAWRIGLFLIVTFGLPLTAYGLDTWDGYRGNINEAIDVVTTTGVGLLFYLVLLVALARPCWRRMSAIGLPGWSSLLIPFLMFCDYPVLVTKTTGFGQAFNSFDKRVPIYAVTAVCLIVAMAFASVPASNHRGLGRFGLAGKIATAIAVLIVAHALVLVGLVRWYAAVVPHLSDEDTPPTVLLFFMKNGYWPMILNPYFCVALIGLAARCAFISRQSPIADPFTTTDTPSCGTHPAHTEARPRPG